VEKSYFLDSYAAEFASVKDATRANMPRHIWKQTVELFASRAGVSSELVTEWQQRILKWYASGQPVWLAVESLVAIRTERGRPTRSSPREQLQSALKSCNDVLSRQKA
jgi:hypothetical protein